jgi:ribosomal protein L29
MEYKEILLKEEKELTALISEGRAKLQALRLKRTMNQLKDVREIREVRKDIARMMMALGAKTAQK